MCIFRLQLVTISIYSPKLAKVKISDDAEGWCTWESMELFYTVGKYVYYATILKDSLALPCGDKHKHFPQPSVLLLQDVPGYRYLDAAIAKTGNNSHVLEEDNI